ncbi:1140_t:CDS:2, partial [Racocetra fulgida]
ILILSTSEPNSLCYVETKNLDGETNLKIRSSVPEIDHLEAPEDCTSIRFFVDSQPPAANLYSYNATLVFPDGLPDRPRSRGGPTKIPVNFHSMLLRDSTDFDNKLSKEPFTDKELSLDAKDQTKSETIKDFFTLLAICHTVLVSTSNNGEPQYKAQSPDEAALVQAAKDVGYVFHSRDPDSIFITTPEGEKVRYELLNILEFTSARKRMSIIVRNPLNRRIILFCKGADNVIFDRLKLGQDYIVNVTGEHLEEFAREGYTEISQEEYNKWNIEFREATTALNDRDKKVAAISDKIERELILLGATAIEDRLQDGVPECIATLKRAGIKIWVLTGDKMETAISIGFSTCLLNREMNLIIIRGGAYGEPGSAYEQMRNAVEKFFPSDLDIL